MSTRSVVLDTNVLVTALLSSDGAAARLFLLLLRGEIKSYTSFEILEEMDWVLGSLRSQGRIADVDSILIDVFRKSSSLVDVRTKVKIVLADPDDDKFLACALDAHAKFLITEDNHLLVFRRWSGIRIVTPAMFLREYER